MASYDSLPPSKSPTIPQELTGLPLRPITSPLGRLNGSFWGPILMKTKYTCHNNVVKQSPPLRQPSHPWTTKPVAPRDANVDLDGSRPHDDNITV